MICCGRTPGSDDGPAAQPATFIMVFADSHVEWSKQDEWLNATDAARARWNNDHRLHHETW